MTDTTLDRAPLTDMPPTTPGARLPRLRHRWPAIAGVGMAAFSALGMSDGTELAPILAASGVVYLGAAALRRPAAAWPMFFATVAVITAARVTDTDIDPTWILLGLAPLFAGYGLLRGAVRPPEGLPLQTLAMVGFGLAAAIALTAGGDLGAYLVAAGLLGHAAWDVWHHRANRVVARSLAEFCVVLDTLAAAAIVVVTIQG